jgi:hypothetical protein
MNWSSWTVDKKKLGDLNAMHKYNGVKQKDKFFVQVSWFVKVLWLKKKVVVESWIEPWI